MKELYINGTRADIDSRTVIALSVAANKMQDIKTRSGARTNKIELPLTQKNLLIVGNINQVTSASEFNATAAKAELFDNGALYNTGFVELIDITDVININILSGNSEWFSLVGDKLLSELDYTDISHTFSNVVVNGNRQNDHTAGFVYANCNYGAIANPGDPYSIFDFYPCIYFPYYLSKIVSSIGWTVKGTLLTDPLFLKTVLPFTNMRMFTPASYDNPLTVVDDCALDLAGVVLIDGAEATSALGMGTPVADSLHMVTVGGSGVGKFTPVQGGGYFFRAEVTLTLSAPANRTLEMFVLKTGTLAMIWSQVLTIVPGTQTINFDFFTPVIEAGQGCVIQFVAGGLFFTDQIDTMSANLDILASRDYDAFSQTFPGANVIMSQAVPEGVKQKDFLTEVFNRFGIIATSDIYTKTITLNKFSDLYVNTPKAIDMSKFIDTSKPVKINYSFGDYAKKNWFRNAEDAEGTAFYGDGYIEINKGSLPEETNVYESKFAPVFFLGSNPDLAIINIRAPRKKSIPRIATITIDASIILSSSLMPPLSTNAQYRFEELRFDTSIIPGRYSEAGDIIKDQRIFTIPIRLNALHIAQLSSDFEFGLSFNAPIYIDVMSGDNHIKGYFYWNDVKQFVSDQASTDVELVRLIKST